MTNLDIPKELKNYTEMNTGWTIHSQGNVHALIAVDGKSIVAAWRYGVNTGSKKPYVVYAKRAVQSMLGDDTYYRLTREVNIVQDIFKNEIQLDTKRMFYIPAMNIIDIKVDKKSRKYYIKKSTFGLYSVPREKVKAVSDEVIERYDKILAEVLKLSHDYVDAGGSLAAGILKGDISLKMRAHIAVLEEVDSRASKWVSELDGLVDHVIDRARKIKIRRLKNTN